MDKWRSADNRDSEIRSSLVVVVRERAEHRGRVEPLDEKRGLYVPAFFEVGFVDGKTSDEDYEPLPAIYLEMGPSSVPGGGPDVQLVRIRPSLSRLTPEQFRRIPYATFLRVAVAAAAGTRDEVANWKPHEIKGGGRSAAGNSEEWRERRASFDELARRPVGRPRLEETLDLEEVARVAAAGAPRHVKAVMDHFGLPSRTTARRWIARARAATNA